MHTRAPPKPFEILNKMTIHMRQAVSDADASGFEGFGELLDLGDAGSPGMTIGDSGLEGTGESSSSPEFSSTTGNIFSV